ncbi:hypothetical protein L7F22_020985 [Adiantum nelumboides]|nr:hypothetical protein [Adiantum nelumboides]
MRLTLTAEISDLSLSAAQIWSALIHTLCSQWDSSVGSSRAAEERRRSFRRSPRVEFCGYSVPHPSENRVNIRIQTTGDPAKDVLKDALQDLMVMCQHIRKTFDIAVDQHKAAKGLGEVSMKSGVTEPSTSRSQASQHKAK